MEWTFCYAATTVITFFFVYYELSISKLGSLYWTSLFNLTNLTSTTDALIKLRNPCSDDTYIVKVWFNTIVWTSAKGYFELVLTRLKNKQAGFVAAFGAADEGYAGAIDKVEKLIADII